MSEPSKRFARLEPLSSMEGLLFATTAIKFFSTQDYFERCKLIGKEENGTIRPFSFSEFLKYIEITGLLERPHSYIHVLDNLLTRLVSEKILTSIGFSGIPPYGNLYLFMKELSTLENKSLLWLTPALGVGFLLDCFRDSIVHISGATEDGDVHGGTGLVIHPRWILTCAHVINGMILDNKQTISGIAVNVKNQLSHKTIDVGIIEVDQDLPMISGLSFREPAVLDTAITVGYPRVPQSREALLVLQRGEVTAPQMTNFSGQNLFLYSAIARPGNSGGPILSNSGHVLGIVSEDLSEQGQPLSSTFYAGVPSSQIVKALNELNPDVSISVEDYS